MTSYIGNLKVYTHTHELINDVRRIIEYKINIQKLRMNLGTMNNPIRKLRKKFFYKECGASIMAQLVKEFVIKPEV